jgi:hypothetical protein
MIVRLVKWIEVEVETNDPKEAMNIVDAMDADGSLGLQADYYDAETDIQLN